MQELAHLDCESAPQAVLDALARDGAVIVDGLLEPAISDATLREARPFLERSTPGEEDFGGTRTVRSGALVARCPSCRPVVLHPLVIAVAQGLLGPSCERFQLHVSQCRLQDFLTHSQLLYLHPVHHRFHLRVRHYRTLEY